MVIVSQDKKDVAVFDNMKILGVRGHKIAITDNITTSGSAFVIGEYKTEERAKEVLEEITLAYSNIGKCIVYKMPKE